MTPSPVRRQAIELLCAAQADGRMPVELFESRLAAVQEASNDAVIEAIVADLVSGEMAAVPYQPAAPVVPFSEQMRLSSVLGSTNREGNWVVPYRLELLSVLGEMTIDFREAILPDDLIDVDVAVTLGSVVLIVPRGTEVQNEVDATLGSSEHKRKGKSYMAPNGLVLRVTGRVLLGSLEIRER